MKIYIPFLGASIANMLKETSEAVVRNTGYTFDERTGLYYDHKSGYYYDPVCYFKLSLNFANNFRKISYFTNPKPGHTISTIQKLVNIQIILHQKTML